MDLAVGLWCMAADPGDYKAAKASAKWEDDEAWSKESDYY